MGIKRCNEKAPATACCCPDACADSSLILFCWYSAVDCGSNFADIAVSIYFLFTIFLSFGGAAGEKGSGYNKEEIYNLKNKVGKEVKKSKYKKKNKDCYKEFYGKFYYFPSYQHYDSY